MKNVININTPSGETVQVPTEKSMSTKLISLQSKTPFELKNRNVESCTTKEAAISLISLTTHLRRKLFYDNNKLFIPKPPKSTIDFDVMVSDEEIEEIMNLAFQPVENFCEKMKKLGEIVYCVEKKIVEDALRLVPFSVEVEVYNANKMAIEDGVELAKIADSRYEEQLKRMKIGRRTRQIIFEKNNQKETNLLIL